jgi:hypothetical protein
MKVMSILDLRPPEACELRRITPVALSRSLTSQGQESVLVFKELPPHSSFRSILMREASWRPSPSRPLVEIGF